MLGTCVRQQPAGEVSGRRGSLDLHPHMEEPGAMWTARSGLLGVLLGLLAACSDGAGLDRVDGGVDAGLTDSGPRGVDAALEDAGAADRVEPSDAGAARCEALDPTTSPERAVALTGRLDLTDYDTYDDRTGGRLRSRVGGFNFFTGTLPVSPLSDGALFTGVAPDTCVAFDLPVPSMDLRPARNVGTTLELSDGAAVTVRFRREDGAEGPRYVLATQADTLAFFDPARVALARSFTWSTPGDRAAGVGPASAAVGPLEDFEVEPAFTATSAPAVLAPSGVTIRWTPPVSSPAQVAIVLARALDPSGNARYLVCRPIDDGEHTISAAALADFGPIPGLAFDLAVARTAMATFCNEGVPLGAAVHTLVYLGAGIVP